MGCLDPDKKHCFGASPTEDLDLGCSQPFYGTPPSTKPVRKPGTDWLVVGGLEHQFYFPIYWEWSSQLTFIFFRGVQTTNQVELWCIALILVQIHVYPTWLGSQLVRFCFTSTPGESWELLTSIAVRPMGAIFEPGPIQEFLEQAERGKPTLGTKESLTCYQLDSQMFEPPRSGVKTHGLVENEG